MSKKNYTTKVMYGRSGRPRIQVEYADGEIKIFTAEQWRIEQERPAGKPAKKSESTDSNLPDLPVAGKGAKKEPKAKKEAKGKGAKKK